ncbi:MAG: hypothetical protein F2675_05065 [Actinobacteria bacterium]|uniref:Unannotated protein n=1 Tax=freshwater metagenome TaxID=449393 RepID=A0A6J6QFN6_9ZZZZ|nr:hypothetical protein [Actinomycetota bacterium]
MRPFSTTRLSKAAKAELGIAKAEKVLALGTESATSDLLVVATNRALYLQSTQERIRWDALSKAIWAEPVLTLTLIDGTGQVVGERIVELGRTSDLPAAIYDRVTDSVIVSERADLGDGAAAMLVARRNSDADEIWWAVVFEAGLDPKDPVLITRAAAELAQLRESLGI